MLPSRPRDSEQRMKRHLVLQIVCAMALHQPSVAQSDGLDARCRGPEIVNRALCAASVGTSEASPADDRTESIAVPSDAAPLPAIGSAPLPTTDGAPVPAGDAPIPVAGPPSVGTLDAPLPPEDAVPRPAEDFAPLPPMDSAPLPQTAPTVQPPLDAAPLPPGSPYSPPNANNPVGQQLAPAIADYAEALEEVDRTGSDDARRKAAIAGSRILAICTRAGYRSIADCADANGLELPAPR